MQVDQVTKFGVIAATILVFVGTQSVAAGFRIPIVSDVVEKAADVVESVVKVAVPIQPAIDIVRGRKTPDQAISGLMNDAAGAVTMVNQTTRDLTNLGDQTFEEVAAAIGGDVGKVIYQFGSGPNRIVRELAFSGVDAAVSVLQGQDPLVALAFPLAAAIRDGRNYHFGASLPLPEDVKTILAPIVPLQVLNRARYTVGAVKMSLPGVIDIFGDADAVTLDDVIVFFQEPELQKGPDIELLAHELYHVYQFMNWGVDLFAYRYISNYRQVESEADQAGGYARNYWDQLNSNQQIVRPDMSFAGMQNSFSVLVEIETPLGLTTINRPISASSIPAFSGVNVFTDQCIIQGEYVVLTSSNQVLSVTRNGLQVGNRYASNVQGCAFEMVDRLGKRFCVANQGAGFVFTPGVNAAVGQCRPCQNQGCFN